MVDPLPRLRPSPLPSINPVPEYLADDALKRVYEETKLTLQVPWMGVVTMAFAHYPSFFDTLWGGLSQLAGSREFVEACRALRVCAEDAAFDSDFVRSDTSIFRLLKRCRRSDGIAREK